MNPGKPLFLLPPLYPVLQKSLLCLHRGRMGKSSSVGPPRLCHGEVSRFSDTGVMHILMMYSDSRLERNHLFVIPHTEPVLLAIFWALMKPDKLCSGGCTEWGMRLILILEAGENWSREDM